MNARNVAAIHASLNGLSLVHAAREPGTTDEDLREAIAALLASDGVLHPKALTIGDILAHAPDVPFDGLAERLERIARGEP